MASGSDVEKAAGIRLNDSTSSGSATPTPRAHRNRDRLRRFLLPNGRFAHVARDPVDADDIRARLQQTGEHGDAFDVYVQGSAEHLEALRHAHTHHESQRRQLREEHAEVYERVSRVEGELANLSTELNRITDHGVTMDAHFNRFGYNAHIRSYDDEDELSPIPSNHSRKNSCVDADRGENPLSLIKRPVVRQYMHKGIIWRASAIEEVMSFELFVDLLYVGIIAINGDAASEDPTGQSLLRFVITLTLSWKIWNDLSLLISWFSTDDMYLRLSILFSLICLFGYTTNILEAFEHTYATLIGFYITARLYMISYLVFVAILVPMVRGTMVINGTLALISVVFWIGSIHVEYPNQLALIWIAMMIDFAGHGINIIILNVAKRIGGPMKVWSEKWYEYVPALNIEHRTERTNAFVTLVFGYTVVAILYQSAVNGIDAFFGKGVMGLIQAFIFNWIYFEIDQAHMQTHAIRRHMVSAMLWGFAHLPFIMSYVLGSGALARLVLTRDTESAHLESLTEVYQQRSEEEVLPGHRWFYCGGFGLALAFMGLISLSHVHKDYKTVRLSKRFRIAMRFIVSIILICLPTAENLNSLDLIGLVTGLLVFQLLVELVGSSTSGSTLWKKENPECCTGYLGKKNLKEYVHGGKELDLGEDSGRVKELGLSTAPM